MLWSSQFSPCLINNLLRNTQFSPHLINSLLRNRQFSHCLINSWLRNRQFSHCLINSLLRSGHFLPSLSKQLLIIIIKQHDTDLKAGQNGFSPGNLLCFPLTSKGHSCLLSLVSGNSEIIPNISDAISVLTLGSKDIVLLILICLLCVCACVCVCVCICLSVNVLYVVGEQLHTKQYHWCQASVKFPVFWAHLEMTDFKYHTELLFLYMG